MSIPLIVFISGPETLLAQRAETQAVNQILAAHPDADVTRLQAAEITPGSLAQMATPSLFGGQPVILIRDLDAGSDASIEEVVRLTKAYAQNQLEAFVIITHGGGRRGARAVKALQKAKVKTIKVPLVKGNNKKTAFVQAELRAAKRSASPEAITILVQSLGQDLRELAAAVAQLVADTTGKIDAETVNTYYGGRVEVQGFAIAQAASSGQVVRGLEMVRTAISGGTHPVSIVAALGRQLRQIGLVASSGQVSNTELARELRMAPWQVDRVRAAVRGWDGERLGKAIQVVAATDIAVKGGSRDPAYAVEQAVIKVARLQRTS